LILILILIPNLTFLANLALRGWVHYILGIDAGEWGGGVWWNGSRRAAAA
jgi:hypothetical protein